MAIALKEYQTVLVEREEGITWVILNRPEHRNAMNPTMHFEMLDLLTELEADPDTGVLVLTGAGESWCAGQDLKQSFRDLQHNRVAQAQMSRAATEWRWGRLFNFPRPTIAMVNGYCYGGAFGQLIACDLAIAAEDAVFGLSQINWGSFPGGLVSRLLADTVSYRDAMQCIMTGLPFDGKQAAAMRLVNYAVPREQLREETAKLARKLLSKNPAVLRACREVYKTCRTMTYWQAEEYMSAKMTAMQATDPEKGRDTGIRKFLDEKQYRPGFEAYPREG